MSGCISMAKGMLDGANGGIVCWVRLGAGRGMFAPAKAPASTSAPALASTPKGLDGLCCCWWARLPGEGHCEPCCREISAGAPK